MASFFLVVCVNLVTMGGKMVDALSQVREVENLKYSSSCPYGKLDDSKFGSPMPIVGSYIALATLVCFLCIIYDLWSGFHGAKSLFPCNWFHMNSFTLTLVSIATKLSVDISTSMPSDIEQLSKLTSTGFLCIVMGFFMPSVASSRTSECLANLGALTVLVVTVIVNVVIQIITGAIFAFVAHHIIVLICMSLLLVLLWSSASQVRYLTFGYAYSHRYIEKQTTSNRCLNGLNGMKQELGNLFTYSCTWNPQFLCCATSNCSSVGLLCGLVAGVLLFALVVFKEMGFCNGVSDYRWSVICVVVIQICTIFVGTFLVCYRWLIIVRHRSLKFEVWKTLFMNETLVAFFSTFTLEFHLRSHKYQTTKFIIKWSLSVPNVLIVSASTLLVILCLMVRKICSLWKNMSSLGQDTTESKNTEKGSESNDTWRSVDTWKSIYNDDVLDKWTSTMAKEKMEKLMMKSKRDAPTPLINLLSKTFPSTLQQVSLLRVMKDYRSDHPDIEAISRQSIVTLAKISTYSISNDLNDCLTEALELINFIENKMEPGSLKNKADEYRERLDQFFELFKRKPKLVGRDDLDQALKYIEDLRQKADGGSYKRIICTILKDREYANITELSDYIEQAFVDILHYYLTNLPMAIFMEFFESPIKESEARTGSAVKFMCILELLNDKVPLKWPDYSAIINKRDTIATLPVTGTYENADIDPPSLDEMIYPPSLDEMIQEMQYGYIV